MTKPTIGRAFTMVEVLVVIVILAVLAAILFPVYTEAKRSAAKSACSSTLRQFGVAMALYREANGGADVGTPIQMGMPPTLGQLSPDLLLSCRGQGGFWSSPGFDITWPYPGEGSKQPDPEGDVRAAEHWAKYVASEGAGSVFAFDASHQDKLPKNASYQSWFAMGVRLDSTVVTRTRLGYPKGFGWWHR